MAADTAATTVKAVAKPTVPARAKAVAATHDTAAKPSYVFLRVKRKRTDDPLEQLVVESTVDGVPEPKKQHVDRSAEDKKSTPLAAAFSKLSTKDASTRFVFQRIDTMERDHLNDDKNSTSWTDRLKSKVKTLKAERQSAKKASTTTVASAKQSRTEQHRERVKAQRQSEMQRAREGLPAVEIKQQKTHELPGVRVVDLAAVTGTATTADTTDDASKDITMNGQRLRPMRVLNPGERELDEAIWTAFRMNDFSGFFRILHAQRPEIKTNPTLFQRPADGTTILMAAAAHGRADVIESLLRSDKGEVLQQDWTGATAATYAARQGHVSVEQGLRACEEAEREKDFVYDVYCVDVSATKQGTAGDATPVADNASAPVVVDVSPAVQRWLSQDMSAQQEADGDVEEYMLASDVSDDEEDDNASIDSNDENYIYNDYPDEESSDSEFSRSEDEFGDY